MQAEPDAATPVSIVIAHDTTFSRDVILPQGYICSIKPGVTIRFAGQKKFTVRGMLVAEGTRDLPITFTGVDRTRGSNEPPCWQGMEILGGDERSVLRHCRFEGAFRILVWGSSPLFDSCAFIGNHYALYCSKKAAPNVKSCFFSRNKYGIVADYSSPLLLDNVITANIIGVNLQMGASLIAGRNTITGNETDIKSDESFGENKENLSAKKMWDLMRQMY
jgi:hypothetical protein